MADEFMRAAYEQALKSYNEGGLPIGAAMIENGALIAVGHNRRVQDGDPIAHGEMDCLRNAGRRADYAGVTLYTTLSPCMMCTGTVVQFGIKSVVVGGPTGAALNEHARNVIARELPIVREHGQPSRARLSYEHTIERIGVMTRQRRELRNVGKRHRNRSQAGLDDRVLDVERRAQLAGCRFDGNLPRGNGAHKPLVGRAKQLACGRSQPSIVREDPKNDVGVEQQPHSSSTASPSK